MRITSLCKYFNCLPYAGGVMEQPGAAMLRMERVIDAYNEYEDFESKKGTRVKRD
jgi:hypothetical protein